MSVLTLPGDIPGLLRKCSPVVGSNGFRSVMIEACGGWRPAVLSEFALDLTDATGRAHATWWLLHAHTTAAAGLAEQQPRDALWCLDHIGGWHIKQRQFYSCHGHGADIGALNPNNPRALDDGSRWVDAEALRLVCLHVAGR